MMRNEAGSQNPVSGRMATLSDHTNALDKHIESAQNILIKIGEMADKIGGPVPQAVGGKEEATPPDSSINMAIARSSSKISALHSLIVDELTRLENSVR